MAVSVAGIRFGVVLRNAFFRSMAYCTQSSDKFDMSLLDLLVCPLSKEPLRYDKEKSELVCDKLNVAYPVIDGIPNLIPSDARLIKEGTEPS